MKRHAVKVRLIHSVTQTEAIIVMTLLIMMTAAARTTKRALTKTMTEFTVDDVRVNDMS